MSFRWKANYETLSRMLDLPACKSRRGERAMASIVYDAALSAREDPQRRISYSRRKAFYSTIGRYDGTEYGYETVVPAIDALVEAGLLIDHDRVRGGPGGTGVQSSFRPAPGLADIVLPRPDYRVGEIIRLKDPSGTLVGYRDTERTARDRRSLEAVNKRIAQANIRLAHINGVTMDENAGTIFFPGFLQWLDEGLGDHTVYTRMNALYRVYNGGWTLGGRYYGGWWQQVRGCDRQHLLIDGAETVELDYEMLHPRLLYATNGKKLAGDAYTLDGWDRTVCKRAFNILLNAGSYPRALGAILPHVYNNRAAAAALIAEIKKRHAPVANSFHSGAGLRLQNVDAEIVKSVLHNLTLREGTTVLPIHDSFVVQKKHETALEAAMDEALAKATSCVGDRQTVSNGWSRIYPHREGMVQPCVDGGPRCPGEELSTTRLHDVAFPVGCSPSDTRSSLPDPVATGHASSDGMVLNATHVPNASATAHGEAIPVVAPSGAGEPDAVIKRQQEARQSTIGNPIPLAEERTMAKAIPPPTFLNPANWNKVVMADLHRAADRPLRAGRTVDSVPGGKQRRSTSLHRRAR